jgi:hypothetical protein
VCPEFFYKAPRIKVSRCERIRWTLMAMKLASRLGRDELKRMAITVRVFDTSLSG